MAIFALGDLHLSNHRHKPMDIFGEKWENHPRKISSAWNRIVNASDLVIVAGDISWAMHLEEAAPDLAWLAALPGQKLILRGNHDYWWKAISKVRQALPAGMHALQNDSYTWNGWSICGTRGWLCPGEEGFDPVEDGKIYRREAGRLKLSLQSAIRDGCRQIVTALHFPPFNRYQEPSLFTEMMEQAGVAKCVFGHIHGPGWENVFSGTLRGIEYYFVAADAAGFSPVRIT